MDTRLIAKLHDVDPIFRDLIDELYGVSKASPDGADVSTPVPPAQSKSKKKLLAGGLLAGAGIEAIAAKHTLSPLKTAVTAVKPAFTAADTVGGRLGALKPLVARRTIPAAEATAAKPAKGLDRLGAGTNTALQAGNFAVGLGAAKELTSGRKKKTDALGKAAVPGVPHMQPKALVTANARTRTAGLRLVRPATTVPMAKAVGARQAYRSAKNAAVHAEQATANSVRATGDAADTAAKVNRLIPSRRKAAAIGTGAVAGVAAGAGGGAYLGAKKVMAPPKTTTAAVAKSVTFTSEITKVDTDKRQVFGWANVAEMNGQPVVDLQGDYVPIEEMESSAYSYVLTSRKGGHMHKRIGKALDQGPVHVADLVESFVSTPEKLKAMGLAPDAMPLGWWTGFKVNDDDVWAKVKSGELTGLSIHGTGRRVTA